MKNTKRIISVFLCLAMLFSCIPAAVFASDDYDVKYDSTDHEKFIENNITDYCLQFPPKDLGQYLNIVSLKYMDTSDSHPKINISFDFRFDGISSSSMMYSGAGPFFDFNHNYLGWNDKIGYFNYQENGINLGEWHHYDFICGSGDNEAYIFIDGVVGLTLTITRDDFSYYFYGRAFELSFDNFIVWYGTSNGVEIPKATSIVNHADFNNGENDMVYLHYEGGTDIQYTKYGLGTVVADVPSQYLEFGSNGTLDIHSPSGGRCDFCFDIKFNKHGSGIIPTSNYRGLIAYMFDNGVVCLGCGDKNATKEKLLNGTSGAVFITTSALEVGKWYHIEFMFAGLVLDDKGKVISNGWTDPYCECTITVNEQVCRYGEVRDDNGNITRAAIPPAFAPVLQQKLNPKVNGTGTNISNFTTYFIADVNDICLDNIVIRWGEGGSNDKASCTAYCTFDQNGVDNTDLYFWREEDYSNSVASHTALSYSGGGTGVTARYYGQNNRLYKSSFGKNNVNPMCTFKDDLGRKYLGCSIDGSSTTVNLTVSPNLDGDAEYIGFDFRFGDNANTKVTSTSGAYSTKLDLTHNYIGIGNRYFPLHGIDVGKWYKMQLVQNERDIDVYINGVFYCCFYKMTLHGGMFGEYCDISFDNIEVYCNSSVNFKEDFEADTYSSAIITSGHQYYHVVKIEFDSQGVALDNACPETMYIPIEGYRSNSSVSAELRIVEPRDADTYTFYGWCTTTTYQDSSTYYDMLHYSLSQTYTATGIKEDMYLYAVWQKPNIYYTIIFDDNGGAFGPGTYMWKKGVDLPNVRIPQLADNDFYGYYDQRVGGNQYFTHDGYPTSGHKRIDDDITLYAHWQPQAKNSFHLCLNGNRNTGYLDGFSDSNIYIEVMMDGSVDVSNIFKRELTVEYDYNGADNAASLPESNTTVSTFLGWALGTPNSTKKLLLGSGATSVRISAQILENNGITVNAGDYIYLYAVWQDGSVTLPAPVKSGYDFSGWYLNGYLVGINGEHYTPDVSCKIRAEWSDGTIQVSFDPNTNNETSVSFYNGKTVSAKKGQKYSDSEGWPASGESLIRDGYDFTGWHKNETYWYNESDTAALGKFNNGCGTKIGSNTLVTSGNNHTVYAQWAVRPEGTSKYSRSGDGVLFWDENTMDTRLTVNDVNFYNNKNDRVFEGDLCLITDEATSDSSFRISAKSGNIYNNIVFTKESVTIYGTEYQYDAALWNTGDWNDWHRIKIVYSTASIPDGYAGCISVYVDNTQVGDTVLYENTPDYFTFGRASGKTALDNFTVKDSTNYVFTTNNFDGESHDYPFISYDGCLVGGKVINYNNTITVTLIAGEEDDDGAVFADTNLKTKTVDIDKDGTYGTLPSPTYEGHMFDGWYYEETNTKITADTPVVTAGPHTLTAHWSESKGKVLYMGSNSSLNVTCANSYISSTKKNAIYEADVCLLPTDSSAITSIGFVAYVRNGSTPVYAAVIECNKNSDTNENNATVIINNSFLTTNQEKARVDFHWGKMNWGNWHRVRVIFNGTNVKVQVYETGKSEPIVDTNATASAARGNFYNSNTVLVSGGAAGIDNLNIYSAYNATDPANFTQFEDGSLNVPYSTDNFSGGLVIYHKFDVNFYNDEGLVGTQSAYYNTEFNMPVLPESRNMEFLGWKISPAAEEIAYTVEDGTISTYVTEEPDTGSNPHVDLYAAWKVTDEPHPVEQEMTVSEKKTYVTLTNGISVNLVVPKAPFQKENFTVIAYNQPYIEVGFMGNTYKLSIEDRTTKDDNYIFTFKNIAPQYIGEEITYSLFAFDGYNPDSYAPIQEKDKNNVPVSHSFTIKGYCEDFIGIDESSDNTSPQELVDLCCDILNYGAASQEYVGYDIEHLANEHLTSAQKNRYDDETVNVTNTDWKETSNGTGATWKGASLYPSNKISLRFSIKGVSDGCTIKITDEDGNILREYGFNELTYVNSKLGYRFEFDGLDATQMNDKVYVTAYNSSGNAISTTMCYSVRSYIYSALNEQYDDSLAKLAKCIYCYGLSAKAYDIK